MKKTNLSHRGLLTNAERKYRAKMVKAKKRWLVIGMVFGGLLLGGVCTTNTVEASEWQATPNTEIAKRIVNGQTEYTFQEGDTYWEIGQAVNIDPFKLMELNGCKEGEQYTVQIGTVISFDGSHVTVKDKDGNTIADEVLKDSDKLDQNKTFAGQASDTPTNTNVTTNNGSTGTNTNSGSTTTNGGSTNTNTNNGGSTDTSTNNGGSTKPVDPVDPVDPIDPSDLTLEEQLAKLKAQLVKEQAKLKDLEGVLTQTETELREAQTSKDKATLEQELQEKQAQKVALEQEVNQLTTKYTSTQTELKTLQQEALQLETEYNATKATDEALTTEVTKWTEAVNQATQKVKEAQAVVDSATAETPATEAQKQAVVEANTVLTNAQTNLANAKTNQANSGSAALKQKLDAKNAAVEAKQAEVNNTYIELNQTKGQQEQNEVEIAEAQKNLDNVKEVDTKALEEKVAKTKAEIETQKKVIAEIEAKITEIELKIEKRNAKAVINQLAYLSSSQKQGYVGQIEGVTAKGGTAAIIAEAQAQNEKEKYNKELAQLKTEAKANVNQLKYLSKEQKADFIAQIEGTTEKDVVTNLVAQAKTADDEAKVKQELQKAKEEAIQKVNAFKYLTDTQKQGYADQINALPDQSGLQAIIDQAAQVNEEEFAKVAFKEYQEAKAKEVEGLKYLTKEQKADFVSQLKSTKDKAGVDSILADANKVNEEGKAAAEFKELQETARKTINGLKYLTDGQKQVYVQKVLDATDKTGVDQALAEANKVNEEGKAAAEFIEYQEANIQKINDLTFLTKEQKAQFITEVKSAKDKTGVDQIVASAIQANTEVEVKQAKTEAKQVIEKLNNLGSTEKETAKRAIEQATSKLAIEEIVNQAKQADQKVLTDAKANAKATINNLQWLTEAEIKDFNQQIDRITLASETESIIEAAKAKDKQNEKDAQEVLLQAKNKGITEVNSLTDLTKQQKADYLKRIENAMNIKDLNGVLEEARETNHKQGIAYKLQAAKDTANANINGLKFLTQAEKQSFIDRVNAATAIPTIDQIVLESYALDNASETYLSKYREEAIKTVTMRLPYLTDSERIGYEDRIIAAKTEEEITQIVEEAKRKNQETDDKEQAPLKEAKEKGLALVEGYWDTSLLDVFEKTYYKSLITNASTVEEVQTHIELVNTTAEARRLVNKYWREGKISNTSYNSYMKQLDQSEYSISVFRDIITRVKAEAGVK